MKEDLLLAIVAIARKRPKILDPLLAIVAIAKKRPNILESILKRESLSFLVNRFGLYSRPIENDQDF